MVPLKKRSVFELLHPQNPYFLFFANVPETTKDIKKIENIEYSRYEISIIKLVCKKLLQNINLSQNWSFVYVSAGQNTIRTEPKEHFSCRSPFAVFRIHIHRMGIRIQ